MTISSPITQGVVATLISRPIPLIRSLIRPSWGNLFSEISSPAISFNLEITGACILIPGRSTSCKTPSTLNRTLKTPR